MRLMFLIIFFLSDMHLSDFLCASLDQCNIPSLLERKKSYPISKLNFQNLANFTTKRGKFFFFFFVAKFSYYFCGKIFDFK